MAIFSLLCCGYGEDADDKTHSQQTELTNSKNKNKSRQYNNNKRDIKEAPTKQAEQDGEQIQYKNQRQQPDTPYEDDSKKLQKDKKDLMDDENSINETDTITNTNDENITQAQENVPDVSTQQAVVTQASEDSEQLEPYEQLPNPEVSYNDLTKLQEGQAFNPSTGYLLGKQDEKFKNKKCLILDLDETLVHSSFKYLRTADFVIPVEIDNQVHHVYVIKRPGVDEFLRKVGQLFEVVVFTASVLKYGDPLLDKLDLDKCVHHRLFRDSCYNYQGNFIKNLSQIGRPLADTIIIDNSPASYIFHPQHAIPISSWFSDTHDNELIDLLPFLEDISQSNVDDVGLVLDITI
ncbi:uncharacterized protein PRCAT00004116001 [Priceomyces carsonii]|uniref:uncharacterized protein n=1 Tax=Priceomyces carsonii TaxID=28549 RepID=UPI002ED7FC20|nr:unnamed protein product [Priceomyces carsonii]